MKTLVSALILLFVAVGVAQGDPSGSVVFSKYSNKLRLVSYDRKTNTHTFRGKLRLTGTLFLIFDMASPDRADGYINFTKFVPDSEYLPQLPTVIGGFYPGKVKYIYLNAPHNQIVSLFGGKAEFGHVSHGQKHEVSRRASVVLYRYSATVECDSRGYVGYAVSVTPLKERDITAGMRVPSGC